MISIIHEETRTKPIGYDKLKGARGMGISHFYFLLVSNANKKIIFHFNKLQHSLNNTLQKHPFSNQNKHLRNVN